jgi:predicted RNA polymerase sigma factor
MTRAKIFDRIPSRTQKAVQDTVIGCRENAAADLARAALMETANARRRLESSALSWTSRADSIQQLEDDSEIRKAVARAEWLDGEEASKLRSDPDAGTS